MLTIKYDMSLELDIQQSLAEYNVMQIFFYHLTDILTLFKYSKWDADPDVILVMDFRTTLASTSPWLSPYSTAQNGCAHLIHITMKVQASKSIYNGFIGHLCSILTTSQCYCLEYVYLLVKVIFHECSSFF